MKKLPWMIVLILLLACSDQDGSNEKNEKEEETPATLEEHFLTKITRKHYVAPNVQQTQSEIYFEQDRIQSQYNYRVTNGNLENASTLIYKYNDDQLLEEVVTHVGGLENTVERIEYDGQKRITKVTTNYLSNDQLRVRRYTYDDTDYILNEESDDGINFSIRSRYFVENGFITKEFFDGSEYPDYEIRVDQGNLTYMFDGVSEVSYRYLEGGHNPQRIYPGFFGEHKANIILFYDYIGDVVHFYCEGLPSEQHFQSDFLFKILSTYTLNDVGLPVFEETVIEEEGVIRPYYTLDFEYEIIR